MPIAGSCCIRCRTLSLLPACLRPALPCRLISCVPSHRSSFRFVISPLFDTVGRGVRRGASGVLLAWFSLRSVPMSIAGSCGVPSVCLLVDSAAWAMAFSSHHAVRAAMSCLLASRLVPRLVLSSRRSGRLISSLAPSCDTMGGEASGCGGAIRLSPPVSFPFACLPRIVPRHPSDTDGGGGLRSIGSTGGWAACLPRRIHAVPSIVSLLDCSFPWLVRLMRLCSVALMPWCRYGFGRRLLSSRYLRLFVA